MSEYDLTATQVQALVRYANSYGQDWKAALNKAWRTGIYSMGDQIPELQQIRNNYGPTWLARLNLRSLQEKHMENRDEC